MKSRIPAILLLSVTSTFAEEPKPERDLVPSGLRPLVVREPRKSNEVTVVLDPPSFEKAPQETTPAVAPPEPPPALIDNLDSLPPAAPAAPVAPVAETPQPTVTEEPLAPVVQAFPKKQGVIVSVEKLQTPTGPIDPADVKLLAPFLAKPKFKTPEGWKLETVSTAPPFNREVEIAPGSKVTLSIRPHVLIPDTDGVTSFPITEPGYNSSLGYQQTSTISALLSNSLHQMESDSKAMGDAIDGLQQLLVSLPKPAAPAVSVDNAPVAKPVRKP